MGSRIVQFGTFQAHLDSGELFREGIRLKLSGQPFQVLEVLLARPGEVVTREELRSAVWQDDTFVDFDQGLNTAINRIREVLGDSASNPRFIETVPRRGYRLIAPVSIRDRPKAPAVEAPLAEIQPTAARSANLSRRWAGVLLGIGAVVAVMGLLLSHTRPAVPVQYKLTQLTRDSGLTHQPSLSADGNFVVFASDRATGKDLDIWIQHVSGGQAVRLTSSPFSESNPSISGDGRKVAFQDRGKDPGIYVVPALGGASKLVAVHGRDPQISPDGTLVAYGTGGYAGETSEIRVVSSEGGIPRTISTGLDRAMSPIWTPDGKHLLVWSRGKQREYDYWMVPATGGVAVRTETANRLLDVKVRSMLVEPVVYTQQNPAPVASVGAGGVVVAARLQFTHDLWFTPLSGGKALAPSVRITIGALAGNPSVASTGRIAYAKLAVNTGLWMLPIDAATGRVTGDMRRLWRENVRAGYAYVSANGKKLAYASNRSGDPDIWVRDLETGAERQLTSSRFDEVRGVLSPDGKLVAIWRPPARIYTIPSTGGEEKLVCEECGLVNSWSPDGKKLLFQDVVAKPLRHKSVDLATGRKQDLPGSAMSPDGLWISWRRIRELSREIFIAPVTDEGTGQPDTGTRIANEIGFSWSGGTSWSPDGNVFYYYREDTLWARKLGPTKAPLGEPILVKRFGESDRPTFSFSFVARDAIYFTMQEMRANLWLAEPGN